MNITEKIIYILNMRMRERYATAFKDVDITEGFTRPCLAVRAEDLSHSTLNEDAMEIVLTVRIYYFPKEGKKAYKNLIEVQEDLRLFLSQSFLIDDEHFYIFSPEVEFDIDFEEKTLTATVIFEATTLTVDYLDEWQGEEEIVINPSIPPIKHEDTDVEMMHELNMDLKED